MENKIKCAVLGATGMVGQRYVSLLENHPWFLVTTVAASENSAGKKYSEAVKKKWGLDTNIPSRVADLVVKNVKEVGGDYDFVFSALDSSIAGELELEYAEAGYPVISNAKNHRLDADVPMLIPEINHHHLDIIKTQQKNRRFKKGFIVVKPNCSLQSYLLALHPLHIAFGVTDIIVTTMQAVSGAGYPGLASLDMIDNLIPFIAGEEEKSEVEPLKIWGKVSGDVIKPDDSIKISAHCNRVNVTDGHTACVSVKFKNKPSAKEILQQWAEFKSLPQELKLPSAPLQPVVYLDDENRPQPKKDRMVNQGMAAVCGRLRECNVFDWRFVCLSHNTLRGAAGGGILNAELLHKKGYL